MVTMSRATRQARWAALISYLGLLSWVVVWHFLLTKEQPYSSFFLALIYIFPLLLPMPGLIKAKPYTHAWANFVILFYIIHGLTIAYTLPAERFYAIVELILASVMFAGCSLFARMRGRELGLKLKKLKTEMEEEKVRFESKVKDK